MKPKPKVLIISLIDRKLDLQSQVSSLEEAELLVSTYGGEVIRVITQNASHRDSSTYLGSGKVLEIKQLIEAMSIDIVVINGQLKSGQLFTLKEYLSSESTIEVWDRPQLILQIFKAHAVTAEAKLQIKLAELKHHGPELSGAGLSMSQQGGGIGTRGIGETNTEIMRRHWQQEIRSVEANLKKVTQNRHQQMEHRKQSGIPTVSIIGYTNAGKTSLFNVLGNKHDSVQNVLFATLDSSVSSIFLINVGKAVYISDTIGFIQDLPPTLIEAFKSTLMETLNADILLHVIDCSDENMSLKIETVSQILKDMDLTFKPQIYVFNKIDLLSQNQKDVLAHEYRDVHHVFVSAKNHQSIDELVKIIEALLIRQGLKRAKHLSYNDNTLSK